MLDYRTFLYENRVFFSFFAAFIVLGAVCLMNIAQGDAILYCSAHRTFGGDLFFKYFTKMGEEPVYLAGVLISLFIAYRYALFIPLLGFVVTFVSFGSKAYFQHDRPMPYFTKLGAFENINLVEGVQLYGGATSFPSGHTMSAFALYSFFAFCMPKKKYTGFAFFLLAFLVGFSRIYLVQHFVKDVYLGAILGVLIGAGIYFLQDQLSGDVTKWWNKSLLKKQVV